MSNKFVTFLDHFGAEAKKAVSYMLTKVLPEAVTVAQAAEPFVMLAAPAIGPEFAIVTNAVAATEASYAASGKQNGTGQEKMAAVLQSVETQLMPTLTAQGLDTPTAQAKIQAYAQAVVTLLNTFPVAIPAPAPAPAA